MSTAAAIKSKSRKYSPNKWVKLDATGVYHKDLNRQIRVMALEGAKKFEIRNVFGQRYLATNLWGVPDRHKMKIRVYGTPGSDMAAFMDGPEIEVFGNVQDAIGNTMNCGKIIVHGSAGDVLGYGMRGGEIYIRGNVGYRVGIHMKEYIEKVPTVVIGGTVQDFFGEYMAGGRIIVLNKFLEDNPPVRLSYFMGTGMHGGSIFIRGDVEAHQIGAEVKKSKPNNAEWKTIQKYVNNFSKTFDLKEERRVKLLKREKFWRLSAKSARPYGRLYAY